MATIDITDRTVRLPGRPWLIAGAGVVCLVRVHGRPLVPVFRSAATARAFMTRLGTGVPASVYPQLPDEQAFAARLREALRGGADGYVLVEPGQWTVIEFTTTTRPLRPPAAPAFAGT